MPRPRKCRRVCHMPPVREFVPRDAEAAPVILLAVEEYETLRLIDYQDYSQEECARYMQVARTTVQMIYTSARKKLAQALAEGSAIRIEGGDYQLCTGKNPGCTSCFKKEFEKPKGDHIMRIAVTYDNGTIFQHFGHTEFFKVYDVEDGKILSADVVSTNGSGHGALAGVLNALQADILICGGIGGGAQAALSEAGIKLYGGVSGSADAAVEALLAGNLAYNPNVMCNHHGEHHHHEEGHSCGSHGCGGGHCH